MLIRKEVFNVLWQSFKNEAGEITLIDVVGYFDLSNGECYLWETEQGFPTQDIVVATSFFAVKQIFDELVEELSEIHGEPVSTLEEHFATHLP